MTQQIINIGAAPNDGTGDQLRTAFDKCNDNFTELYTSGAATTTEGIWNFNQTSTDTTTSPTSGRFRTNSGDAATATQFAIHRISINGFDRADTLRTQLVGDIIKLQDKTNADTWARFVVQATPVDNVDWFQIDVAFDSGGGTAPGNNQEILFTFAASSGGGGGTGNVSNVGTPTNGQLAQWTDATHIQGVDASVLGYAPLASPTFTGDPRAPTPATADNDTSIATTAFVKAQGYEVSINKGVANGYASLDATAKVPAVQLPSYVDDVVEYANLASFPATGTAGIIYVALDTGKIYRWSGSAYVEISPSPGSTDAVPEGAVNLYYTEARVSANATVISKAPLASPTFTGDPQAPTPAAGDNDTSIATTAFVTSAIRVKLTATRNYYVSTTGNDGNDGRTAGTPFLTIQKAIDVACATLDLGVVNVVINVADGTYTGGMVLKSYVGSGIIIIVGNEAVPTNCIINVTNGFPVNASSVRGVYHVRGFHLKAATAGYSCVLASGSVVYLRNIRFEGSRHVNASYAAQVTLSAAISVVGNFDIHIYADTKAIVAEFNQTITIVGTPVITQGWVFAIQQAMVISNANTYNGSCTGSRYYVASLSYVYTGTNGAAGYFPGDAAGSSATGAIYD